MNPNSQSVQYKAGEGALTGLSQDSDRQIVGDDAQRDSSEVTVIHSTLLPWVFTALQPDAFRLGYWTGPSTSTDPEDNRDYDQ